MQIQVNEKPINVPVDTTLQDLVTLLNLEGYRFAIAVNGEIIPRDRWATYRLQEGDRVDLVYAVGGG